MQRYSHFLLAFILSGPLQQVHSETLIPKFEDYSVREQSSTRVSNIRIAHAQDKAYRTMLRQVIGQKPNFAGHFVFTEFGCGASCVRSAAIDAKTGTVYWLPFTVCCFPVEVEDPIRYRLDSSLVEVRGMRDEKGAGTYFYDFKGGKFLLVGEIEESRPQIHSP